MPNSSSRASLDRRATAWSGVLARGGRIAILAAMTAVAIADIHTRSASLLFSPDEVINLDAVLNFYTVADYTTRQFGAVPFDPAVSSGIAATWLQGLVFVLGGNLFSARLLTGLLQFAAVSLLVARFAASRQLRAIEALIIAGAFWVSLLLVGEHEQRIVNPGEVWGVVYLACGMLFVGRSPALAGLCWGVAVWSCKIIYLPFAAALLLATVWVRRGEGGDGEPACSALRTGVSTMAMFAAPLLAWMLVIWLRYDLATLVAWSFSSLAFVTKHSTGATLELGGLPALPGWQFEPQWGGAVLFRDNERAVSFLAPLMFGLLAALRLALFRSRSSSPKDRRETAYLTATTGALALFCLWFFAFDPTRWGRHLLPAIYVSMALGLYCVIVQQRLARSAFPARIVGAIVVILVVGIACARTAAYVEQRAWKGSYARACRGRDVLAPPCKLDKGRQSIAQRSNQWCGLSLHGNDFDEHCLMTMRKRFVEVSAETMRDPNARPHDVYDAGYVILHVQQWAYSSEAEFAADFSAAACGELNETARRFVEDTGLDRSLAGCGADVGYGSSGG